MNAVAIDFVARSNRRARHVAPVAVQSHGREMIRMDVFEAVNGAFSVLRSPIITVRLNAEAGHLDARCTSDPVMLAAL